MRSLGGHAETRATNECCRGRDRRMDEIEMAVDAGHAPFAEERVGRLAAFAHRPNAVWDMATSAGHATLSAHDVANFMRKGGATSLPYVRLIKVIRQFGD